MNEALQLAVVFAAAGAVAGLSLNIIGKSSALVVDFARSVATGKFERKTGTPSLATSIVTGTIAGAALGFIMAGSIESSEEQVRQANEGLAVNQCLENIPPGKTSAVFVTGDQGQPVCTYN